VQEYMTANAFVRARIDESIKNEAAAVLATMGLTVSDVVRITLTKVANEKALPFQLTPNRETIATLERSARGEDLHRADNGEDLFSQLGL
jgi:DNA-damage-inducible protein J